MPQNLCSDIKLQDKITKENENDSEDRMSPSSYDLGYKFNKLWTATDTDYIVAFDFVYNKFLHQAYLLQ